MNEFMKNETLVQWSKPLVFLTSCTVLRIAIAIVLMFFGLIYFLFPKVGQFAEDGSFIGQYVPGKLQPPVSPPSVHQLQTVSSKQQTPNSNGNIGHNSGTIATYV